MRIATTKAPGNSRRRAPRIAVGLALVAVFLGCHRGSHEPGQTPTAPDNPAAPPAVLSPPTPEPSKAIPPPGLPANSPLLHPEALQRRAPKRFRVAFTTKKGTFVVEVTRAWAPHGADRFFNLVNARYYDGVRFHRVIPNGIVQFGIHGDPQVNRAWFDAPIPDDSRRISNTKDLVAFASVGPGQRRTELLVNLTNNRDLDRSGLVPFGRVIRGQAVLRGLAASIAPGQPAPVRRLFLTEGNNYLDREYPWLDRITSARLQPKGG